MTNSISLIPSILWEDSHIIVLNKPSGLLTIRDGYNPELPNLKQILVECYKKIWVVHRLDKQTSGAIIFAKTKEAHQLLSKQFEERTIKKYYHLIVFGKMTMETASVTCPLLVNGDRSHRTIHHLGKGKPAQTDFLLLKTNSEFSLLSAFPLTGYRHQIRAHLSSIGLSILGDDLYTDQNTIPLRRFEPENTRLALHAYTINFTHPNNQEILSIVAPYPDDFLQILKRTGLASLQNQIG